MLVADRGPAQASPGVVSATGAAEAGASTVLVTNGGPAGPDPGAVSATGAAEKEPSQ